MADKTSRVISIVSVAIIAGVALRFAVPYWYAVESVKVEVTPESLPPDGVSEAEVRVRMENFAGYDVAAGKTAVFVLVEGHRSAVLVSSEGLTARLRATTTPGTAVVRAAVPGFAVPVDISVSVAVPLALGRAVWRVAVA
jgi:hypothetical protein